MVIWKSFGASVRGPGHIASGAPNQDSWAAFHYAWGDGVIVSDGLGSKPFSDFGSGAAGLAAACAAYACHQNDGFDQAFMANRIKDNWLSLIAPLEPRDCAATCLFAFRLGDGAIRLGVLGDVAKVNCATCHQGVFKPLYGESLAKDYPELVGAMHAVAASSAPSAPADAVPVGRLYFDVDKSAKWVEGEDSLQSVVDYLKAHDTAKVSISGYHDPSGDVAHNLQLAKARAIVVRKALVSDGIAPDRVSLDKPMETTGTGDPRDARRVEVTVQQ